MASFQLLSVDYYLLTKIINKMDAKSYFRLQQTNKVMNEIIHNNKQICIHLPESYYFSSVCFKDEERERSRYDIDVECLYGIQFAKLHPLDNFFSSNPEEYKRNLELSYPGLSIEDMTILLDIVKPLVASNYSNYPSEEDANRCKAFLQSKTLKKVYVPLDLGNLPIFAPQLLSTFPSVHITGKAGNTEQQVELLRTMIKILRSQPFPNLQNFSLRSYNVGYSVIDFEAEFKDLNWTYEKEYEDDDKNSKDQLEGKLDDLISGCEEEDEDHNKKENEVGETKKEEEEIGEDTDDDEENDDDPDDSDQSYVDEKAIAILDLPNGPCKIVWEIDSCFNDLLHFSMELGDCKSF